MSKRTAKRWEGIAPDKVIKDPKAVKDCPTFSKKKMELVTKTLSHVVEEQDHKKTFGQLASKYFGLGPSFSRFLILKGQIWVNGSAHSQFVKAEPNECLHAGDVLNRVIQYEPITLEKIKENVLKTLYKDERIIVVDKPSGIAMHKGTGNEKLHVEAILEQMNLNVRLTHRLDKDTSGALVLARSKDAATQMAVYFKEGTIIREYLALIAPLDKKKFPKGSQFNMVNGITAVNDVQKCVDWRDVFGDQPDNQIKRAETLVKVLDHRKLATLVRLYPKTGRKHQLRLQCIHQLESHILGDMKYAQSKQPQLYLFLQKIILPDWYRSGKSLEVEAPLPMEWLKALSKFGFHGAENFK